MEKREAGAEGVGTLCPGQDAEAAAAHLLKQSRLNELGMGIGDQPLLHHKTSQPQGLGGPQAPARPGPNTLLAGHFTGEGPHAVRRIELGGQQDAVARLRRRRAPPPPARAPSPAARPDP